MKVSIIIPAYNAENYIKRALDSALEQTIIDKEIIVVVDGAKDCTEQIVKQYSEKFSEIRYVYIENSGLSVARNTGVEIAKGKYIAFLDSDDFFASPNVIENFYNKCEEHSLDVIRGAYKIFDENINDYQPHYSPSFPNLNKPISGSELLKDSIKYSFNEVVAWLGLYKREFLINNGYSFIKGIYYEDHPYFLKMLLNKDARFMQTDEYFYVYVKRGGTITTSLSFKHAVDMAKVVKEELEILKTTKCDKKTKKAVLKYISSSFYQITSVYGRIDKSQRRACVKLVPFWTRVKLMLNPYNTYHFKKIFLYNFFRVILNRYYNRSINV